MILADLEDFCQTLRHILTMASGKLIREIGARCPQEKICSRRDTEIQQKPS